MIELKDYDCLNLYVDHEMVLPNGTTMTVPAGTKLIMLIPHGGGGTLKVKNGSVNKVEDPTIHYPAEHIA